MKFFFNNPFTAPDIKDILRDKNISLRNMLIVFGSGVVLASTLIGGYHIGQWFIGKAIGPDSIPQAEVSNMPTPATIESRLAELGEDQEGETYDVLEASRRVAELESTGAKVKATGTSPSREEIMKARLEELGN